MTAAPIRVVVIDDHPLVRDGVRQALATPGFEVVGEAGTAADGVERVVEMGPDIVILDISLPGENGLSAAAKLRSRCPATKVLMLSVHDHPEYVLESVKAGAHGYLRKDSLPEDLRSALRALVAGQTRFIVGEAQSAEAVAPILAAASQRLDLLSRRERDVLIGVASGKANKEIAADLGLSVRTVESYRETLIRKLGIPSAAGLTRFAIEARLLGG